MTQERQGFFSAMRADEKRAVGTVAGIATCRMFGLFALLPVLAVYSAGLEGATPLLIGVAVGGYGLTQALLQIPFGALSDRFGRRPVIVLGLAVFAAGSALAALSTSIWGVIAGRLLQGFGAISATLTALLADATRPEVRTRTMALFGISIGFAFLLALIVGPVIAAFGGVKLLFWVAAGLAGLGMLLLVTLPAQAEPATPAGRPPLAAALKPALLELDFYVLLLHAMLTASFVALPFVLTDALGMPADTHWQILVTALLLSLAGTVPLILADDRRGKARTMAAAVALVLAGQAVLALADPGRLAVLAGLTLFFAGFNFLEAALPARVSILADESRRGASLGLFASCQFLGAFAGGLVGGLLLGTSRPAAVFVVCAAVALGWLAFMGVAARQAKAAKSAEKQAGI